MNNNIDFTAAKLNTQSESIVIKLSELTDGNHQDVLSQIQDIGNKPTYPHFSVNEEIIFPDNLEQFVLVADGFYIYNGEKRLSLSVLAYNKRYGYFQFPIALLRRKPIQEKLEGEEMSEYERLCEDNNFGERLLILANDYLRAKEMLGITLVVKDKLMLHQYGFTVDKEKKEAHQDTSQLKTLICYKWDKK